MIEAAGAVLWRGGEDGAPQVAVIFRRRHADWTLPKGKLEPGEEALHAALREVAEETGHTAEPGPELGETRYRTNRSGHAQDKLVRYWAMRATGGGFTPNAEVDALRWLAPADARALLTYDRDRELIDRFLAARGSDPPTPRRQPS